MTLEELCECDAATLEKMTDEELEKFFAPMFDITRPERASNAVVKQQQVLAKTNPKLLAGLKLAKDLGIEGLEDSLLKRKKK
jgi:hypothetical protein